MPSAATPASQKDSRVGGLSLIFLAIAVVGPFLTTLAGVIVNANPALANAGPVVVAMGLRLIFLLLALVFGFLGRHSRAGRFGLIGSAVVLGVVLILGLYLFSQHAARVVSPTTISPISPPAP
jgi:hypothetical protein